jgi:PleD family two-component response regulator
LMALSQGERPVTISLGITIASVELSLEELISRADTALYRAKLHGRNRIELDCGTQSHPVAAVELLALQEAS